MRGKILLLLCIGIVAFASCEKEEPPITNKTETEPADSIVNVVDSSSFVTIPKVISIFDTVYASYFDMYASDHVIYHLDINSDSISDLSIEVYEMTGSSGYTSYCYIKGLDNTKLSFLLKERITWIHSTFLEGYTDTVWQEENYLQPVEYHRGDTLLKKVEYSDVSLTMSFNSFSTSGESPFTYSDNHRIRNFNGKQFYIGLNTNDSISWVKMEVLGSTHLVIKEYIKPVNQEGLIIDPRN